MIVHVLSRHLPIAVHDNVDRTWRSHVGFVAMGRAAAGCRLEAGACHAPRAASGVHDESRCAAFRLVVVCVSLAASSCHLERDARANRGFVSIVQGEKGAWGADISTVFWGVWRKQVITNANNVRVVTVGCCQCSSCVLMGVCLCRPTAVAIRRILVERATRWPNNRCEELRKCLERRRAAAAMSIVCGRGRRNSP